MSNDGLYTCLFPQRLSDRQFLNPITGLVAYGVPLVPLYFYFFYHPVGSYRVRVNLDHQTDGSSQPQLGARGSLSLILPAIICLPAPETQSSTQILPIFTST
jgi:hypothetical protein